MADLEFTSFKPTPPQPSELERIALISLHTSPTAQLGQSANGGLNVYVREVASALEAAGVATDVFTRRQSLAGPGEERLGPLTRVVYLPAGSPQLDKYQLLGEAEGFAAEIAAWAVRHRSSYDVIYSHYWLSGIAAMPLRSLLGAPWVHTAHTLAVTKNRHLAPGARPEPQLRVEAEGRIARSADLLVVSTEAEGADLSGAYGVSPDRIRVVAPGVDLVSFHPRDRARARARLGLREDERLLLSVGRLERLKGFDISIRALARLGRPEVRLLVLGEDSKDSSESECCRLRALAAELGVEGQVSFLGSTPQSQLPFFYAAADACLMPSYSESFGLVGLEAQACGCPVIAANVSGLASVVREGVTGRLVDGDDPSDYAARIASLLDDRELARQMGSHGTLLAQRFSWERTAEKLRKEFEELIPNQLRVHSRALQE